MRRGIALSVPGVALVAGAGLWTQARRAAAAPLPTFADGDPSGRYGDPAGEPLRISVLGDSTVTGPGLESSDRVWIARIAAALPYDVELLSHARGGSRIRDVLQLQAPQAALDRPDLFVVAVGANDVIHLTPGPSFRRDLDDLLDLLRPVAPVVTFGIGDLSMIPRVPRSMKPMVARRCAGIDQIHRQVAEDRDGVVRVPVAGLADPHFRRATEDVWAGDRFHPNELGHAIWAGCFGASVRAAVGAVATRSPELVGR